MTAHAEHATATNTRTVAVAGASGFVGRAVVRELLARGFAVRVLARDRAKARNVLPRQGVTIITGEVGTDHAQDNAQSDPSAITNFLTGAFACINLIGIIREDRSKGQTFQKCHTQAVKILSDACVAAGVTRFVQMSALGVKDVHVSEYQRTKFEGEAILKRSGLDWTIFRPSLIHGAEGEFVQTAIKWCSGNHPPFLFLPYFTRSVEETRVPLGGISQFDPVIAPIYVADVASAFVECLDRPQTFGEIYNLAGPERLTWPAMLRVMRDNIPGANTRLQPFGLPGDIAALGAKFAALAKVGQFLPFDEGMAKMGSEDSFATLDKVRTDIGLTPAPFTQTFKSYASALGDH